MSGAKENMNALAVRSNNLANASTIGFKAEGLKSKMILQVHDELNFSVVPEEKFHVKQLVLEEMQNAAALKVPLIADCGFGSLGFVGSVGFSGSVGFVGSVGSTSP